MARSISQRFPSRSPTVGLTCASAIRTAAMPPAYLAGPPRTSGAEPAHARDALLAQARPRPRRHPKTWLVVWLDMADKLVLVTGGAGFIGSTIARALIAEETPVRVFDNLIAGF